MPKLQLFLYSALLSDVHWTSFMSRRTNYSLSIDPVFEFDVSNVLEVFGVVCDHCHVESYGCTAYQQVKVIIQWRTEQTEANFLPLSRNTQMLVSSRKLLFIIQQWVFEMNASISTH